MAHFDTAANIVNSAGKELGIIASDIADPWAETDQNIVQLCALFTRAGRMLVRARNWSSLRRHAIGSLDGLLRYIPLAEDCARFVDDSLWDRDGQQPWPGPATPAQWAALQNGGLVSTTLPPFRQEGNMLYFFTEPPAVDYSYEYISRYWVSVNTTDNPTEDAPDDPAQVIWFDEPLITSALKLAWLRAKQMDTTYAQAEYDGIYAACAGGDQAASTIRLTHPSGPRLLDQNNLPETGYGS
jgi:hypothetical protein